MTGIRLSFGDMDVEDACLFLDCLLDSDAGEGSDVDDGERQAVAGVSNDEEAPAGVVDLDAAVVLAGVSSDEEAPAGDIIDFDAAVAFAGGDAARRNISYHPALQKARAAHGWCKRRRTQKVDKRDVLQIHDKQNVQRGLWISWQCRARLCGQSDDGESQVKGHIAC